MPDKNEMENNEVLNDCRKLITQDRVLINSIRQQKMLKMMTIANDRHFSYQDEHDLVDFIASEMQKEGLNLNNEELSKREVYVTSVNHYHFDF